MEEPFTKPHSYFTPIRVSIASMPRSYVRLLRRISSHYRIGLGREMRNALCSKCNSVLVPGLTANVVLASSKGYAVYTCKRCGAERHIIYKATKGKTRKRG